MLFVFLSYLIQSDVFATNSATWSEAMVNMINTGTPCLDAGCTSSWWTVLRDGVEVQIPLKFAQTGIDSVQVWSPDEGMAFETTRTGHVKLDSGPLDVSLWNVCMKTCP